MASTMKPSKPSSTAYTLNREREVSPDVYAFLIGEMAAARAAVDDTLDFSNFDVWGYAANHYMWIVRKDGAPVGVMFAQLYGNVFDPKIKILFQDGFYVRKSSGRAAYLLFKEFIDFGRANAKIIFTCRGKLTNVKVRTLERLGFEKSEEIFRLVVGEK